MRIEAMANYPIALPNLEIEKLKRFAKRCRAHSLSICAMHGHKWRDDVPGIKGTICTQCGSRPQD